METDNAQALLNELTEWLEKYKRDTSCRGVVLGISGGKDSTTVAMLAKKIWGENVVGVLMPNGMQNDIDDSLDIVKTLAVDYRVVNIEDAYGALIGAAENCGGSARNVISDKAKTNIPPRLRMTVLYALAQSLGYMVIGTGNASESYIGWTTKWGDGAYDFNPIAHLTCTEVIEVGRILAKEFGLDEKYIVKPPSDGLCGKTDEDSFGFTYAALDAYIRGEKADTDAETAAEIERMHRASEHKRSMPARMQRH